MFVRLHTSAPIPPSPASPQTTTNELSEENRFSLAHLGQIHLQLSSNKIITPENEELVISHLYTLAEMVVYGDNKSELLFDFFCEKNMLSLFLDIMWGDSSDREIQNGQSYRCPNSVHIQILQTLAILINSVRNDTSLYYLLSNNYINEIIVFPHIFEEDESLRDQFVSFIKSLSLRLNRQTVQFFFVEETKSFPLLSRAIDFLHFTDPMVRIACQTTILSILQVSDSRSRMYALQDELICKFFYETIKILDLYYYEIVRIVIEFHRVSYSAASELNGSSSATAQVLSRLENSLDDMTTSLEDWMYFLKDTFGLNINRLRIEAVRYLMSQFVYPTLLSSFIVFGMKKLNHDIYSIPRSTSPKSEESEAIPLPELYNKEKRYSLKYSKESEPNIIQGLFGRHAIESKLLSSPRFSTEQFISPESLLTLDRASIRELNGIIGPNASPERSSLSTKFKDALRKSEIDQTCGHESLPEDELAVHCAVTMYFLSQMLRIITDPLLHRAILVALFHPVDAKRRVIALNDPSNAAQANRYPNFCRRSFVAALQSQGRLALSSSLLWLNTSFSTHRHAFNETTDDELVTEEDTDKSIIVSPAANWMALVFLKQSRSLLEWDYDGDRRYATLCSAPLFGSDDVTMNPKPDKPSKIDGTNEASSLGSQLSYNNSYRNITSSINSDTIQRIKTDEAKIEGELSIAQLDTEFSMEQMEAISESPRVSALTLSLSAEHSPIMPQIANKISKEDEEAFISLDEQLLKLGTGINEKDVYNESFVKQYGTSLRDLALLEDWSQDIRIETLPISDCAFQVLSKSIAFPTYSVAHVQVLVHTLYYHALLLRKALIILQQTNRPSDIADFNQNTKNIMSSEEIIGNLRGILDRVQMSTYKPATSIINRLQGPMREVVLDIIVEELRRIEGCSWSNYQGKASQLSLILIPPIDLAPSRLGSEFVVPSSQMDIVRREIQLYILQRSLCIQIRRMFLRPQEVFHIDDICKKVLSDGLWSTFIEKTSIPPELNVGRSFKMKGKRYLDICLRDRDLVEEYKEPPTTQSDSILSTLTFGYFGGRRRSSLSTAPPLSPNQSSPQPNTNRSSLSQNVSPMSPSQGIAINQSSKAIFGEVLFIQDRSYLIIVRPEAPSRPSGVTSEKTVNVFKVYASAPLMYIDASIDLQNKCNLKIIVHGHESDSYHNMDRLSAPEAIQFDNSTRVPALLRPKRGACLFQITIGFEFEQACMLACEHIETRRTALREQKISMLTKALDVWAQSSITSQLD